MSSMKKKQKQLTKEVTFFIHKYRINTKQFNPTHSPLSFLFLGPGRRALTEQELNHDSAFRTEGDKIYFKWTYPHFFLNAEVLD